MSSSVCSGEGSVPPLPWSPSASNCTPHFKSGSKRVSVRAHARNSGGMQSGGRLFTWTTSKSASTTQTHEWPMLTMSPAATCARTPATDADVPLVRPAVDLARAVLDADALPKRGVPKHNWKYLGRGSRKRLDDRPVLRPHLHVVPLLERRRAHAFKKRQSWLAYAIRCAVNAIDERVRVGVVFALLRERALLVRLRVLAPLVWRADKARLEIALQVRRELDRPRHSLDAPLPHELLRVLFELEQPKV
ncbi:hypothetical protein M885DRAFT_533626, partial [Pelagophyceae sp. CCMP2097]